MFNLTNEKCLVIISAEHAERSAAANANATDELRTTLAGYLRTEQADSVLACDGQYKGAPERSFLVICDDRVVLHLANVAEAYNQECVLVGTPRLGAIDGALLYPNGHAVRIGTLASCVPGQDYDASTTIHGTDIAFHFA